MSGGAAKAPLDRLRSRKKPVVIRVPISMDMDLSVEFEKLTAERETAQEDVDRYERFLQQPVPADVARKLEDLDAQIDEMRPQVEEQTETFVFRSMGRRAFDDLKAAHPPSKKQLTDNASKGLGAPEFEPDSFMPVLLSETCTSHAMTPDEWKTLLSDDEWNSAELDVLENAAFNVNVSMRVVDMGKGSGGKRS